MICACGNHCWKVLPPAFVVLVSPADAALLDEPWRVDHDHKGYLTVRRNARTADGRRAQKRLAREIVSTSSQLLADHKNRNTLDNRRGNLREATSRQNAQNRSKRRTSESGCKGVVRHGKKWRARITINGKQIRLGVFLTKEEASKAYENAARVHFGEYAAAGAMPKPLDPSEMRIWR